MSDNYRIQVRETFQRFSDEALSFQDARIVGGIDREECDREKARRSHELQEEIRERARRELGRVRVDVPIEIEHGARVIELTDPDATGYAVEAWVYLMDAPDV